MDKPAQVQIGTNNKLKWGEKGRKMVRDCNFICMGLVEEAIRRHVMLRTHRYREIQGAVHHRDKKNNTKSINIAANITAQLTFLIINNISASSAVTMNATFSIAGCVR